MVVAILGLIIRFSLPHGPPFIVATALFVAIFSAAILLQWGAEAAQTMIRSGLIIAAVAFIAVLPEYGVDMTFSWKAGQYFSVYGEYPVANMTGANRLLIGIGWSLVLFVMWLKTRQKILAVAPAQLIELTVLLAATVCAFTIVARQTISLLDTLLLVGIFLGYLKLTSGVKTGSHEIADGPAVALAALATPWKIAVMTFLFLFSAGVIFLAAEPFAENLLAVGAQFMVEKFILVQWIAPLASEAPEIIIATLFTLHHRPQNGIATLISSNVNQWTLLVGTIPVVYAISVVLNHGYSVFGSFESFFFQTFPLSFRQQEEIFLTAAQCLAGIVILARLKFSWKTALMLVIPFVIQVSLPIHGVRTAVSMVYLASAFASILWDRNRLWHLLKSTYTLIMAQKGLRDQ